MTTLSTDALHSISGGRFFGLGGDKPLPEPTVNKDLNVMSCAQAAKEFPGNRQLQRYYCDIHSFNNAK